MKLLYRVLKVWATSSLLALAIAFFWSAFTSIQRSRAQLAYSSDHFCCLRRSPATLARSRALVFLHNIGVALSDCEWQTSRYDASFRFAFETSTSMEESHRTGAAGDGFFIQAKKFGYEERD